MPTLLPTSQVTLRRLPPPAMLTVTLLLAAWLINGAGPVGVMAPADPGAGQYIRAEALSDSQQIAFAPVDRAIHRLRLDGKERPDQFEAYEDVLQALAKSLPAGHGQRAMERAGQLLRRSLPDAAASELIAVLPDFLRYRQLEQALPELTPDGPRTAEAAWVQLRLQHALRRSVLGEAVADQLYGTAHRMTEIHLVRRLIMQREDLDDAQKQHLIRKHMEALVVDQDSVGSEP